METRVKKYASYRQEIERMSDEEDSTKSKSSKVVSSFLDEKKDLSQTLNLSEALKPYELYDNKKENRKEKRKLGIAGKRILIYSIVASSVILTLLIVLIIIGIIIF